MSNLRTAMRDGRLSDERVTALNAIGFVWNKGERVFEERFQELLRFKKRYGHCNVLQGQRA